MEPNDFIGLPMIYRFRRPTPETIEELAESYVYFPQRSQLNDPFDIYPGLLQIPTDPKKKLAVLRNGIKKNQPGMGKKVINEMIIKALGSLDPPWEKIQEAFSSIIEPMGVCCFCPTPGNLMMWSHYADFHKGLCVGYNIEHDMDLFFGLRRVEYVEKFLVKEYSTDNKFANVDHLFFTKSDVWAKEQELRLVKPVSGKHTVKPQAMRYIIFGIATTEVYRNQVIQKTQPVHPHLKYFQCKPAKNAFGVELHPY